MKDYPLFLAVDLGTTNVRSMIFNNKGKVLGQAFQETKMYRPTTDAAEEDPEEILFSTLKTIRESVLKSKISTEQIVLISFSAQMHGMTMIDRKGKVLTRLMTWLDKRAIKNTNGLGSKIDPYELYSKTGCPLLYTYPLAKIMWAKENLPEKFKRCSKILSIKDFVLYKMLGEAYIDRSLASGTQLLNIHKLNWDNEILEIADIDHDKLPKLVDETEIIGEITKKIAKSTGLKKGTEIIPGASDGALSNIGLGAVKNRIAAVNIGTSGAMRVLSDKPLIDKHQHARFFCYYTAFNQWLIGGAINNAGIILRWFKDTLSKAEIEEANKKGLDPYEIILKKVSLINPGSDGLIMLPFFSGERFPIRDPNIKGALFGLNLSHSRAHIARAVIEGITFTLRWILEILEEHNVSISEVRTGGGGARSDVWRKIQSDIFGKPVIYNKVEEASALGAAMLASISFGINKNLESASKSMVKISGIQKPNYKNNQNYLKSFKMFKMLYNLSKNYLTNFEKFE